MSKPTLDLRSGKQVNRGLAMASAKRTAALRTMMRQEEFLVHADYPNQSVEEYIGRKELVEAAWNEYKQYHQQILELIDPEANDKLEKEHVINDKAEDSYIKVKTTLTKSIADKPKKPAEAEQPAQAMKVQMVQSSLAKLTLKSFGGAYSEWTSFKNNFKSFVHDAPAMPKVEKFQRLQDALFGEPQNMVKRYDLTADNYDLAWAALHERYENKRKLVDAQLTTLLDMPAAKPGDVKSLRAMMDATSAIRETLEKLGIEVNAWDALFVHLVMRRIDLAIKHD